MILMRKGSAGKYHPAIHVTLFYKETTEAVAIVFIILSVILPNVPVSNTIIQSVLATIGNILAVFATGVLITSLISLTDITKTFDDTITKSTQAITEEIEKMRKDIDFTTDIKKFPYEKLSSEDLLELSKEAIRQEINRKSDISEEEMAMRTGMLHSLESYYVGITEDIREGIMYHHSTRIIEIEPDSQQRKLTITMKISQSLEVPAGSKGAAFFHKPVFKTYKEAESLKYSLIRIDGENLLSKKESLNNSAIVTRGEKFRRENEFEHGLLPGKRYSLELEYTFEQYSSTYVHSSVLTYPCAFYEVTCKIVGPEKDLWQIDADAFCAKQHRLDEKHINDVIIRKPNAYENCYIIQQTDRERCLLDGTSYKIVVYPSNGQFAR